MKDRDGLYVSPKRRGGLDELARFRAQWRAELSARKAPRSGHGYSSMGAGSSNPPLLLPTPASGKRAQAGKLQLQGSAEAVAVELGHGFGTPSPLQAKTNFTPKQRKALEIYTRAVQAEEGSALDEALQLYREAFRLYEGVDHLWRITEQQAVSARADAGSSAAASATSGAADSSGANMGASPDSPKKTKPPLGHTKVSSIAGLTLESIDPAAPTVPPELVTTPAVDVKHAPAVVMHATPRESVVTGTLARLVFNFPAGLRFLPEDEQAGVPLDTLPDELLVHILAALELDHCSLERFGAVCWKARVFSLDSAIWRGLAKATYIPPQVPFDDTIDDVADAFNYDYRRLYIEYPRVRIDGVYIAVCHYIRNGLSENPWVNISHLITYHRYLRFFPNGQVISLLANEEERPEHVIPKLKPSLRMKGFAVGTWRLAHNPNESHGAQALVYITDLAEPITPASSSSTSSASGPERAPIYSFAMKLALTARPTGRWNKLSLLEYDSIRRDTGDRTPFGLKHERPFWFSKVRSWAGTTGAAGAAMSSTTSPATAGVGASGSAAAAGSGAVGGSAVKESSFAKGQVVTVNVPRV